MKTTAYLALFLLGTCSISVAAARDAPELSFTVPDGGQIQLSQLSGKVVALEFIYSTCKPCEAAAERMSRLANEFRSRGFEAYVIAFDPNANVLVPDFTKTQRLSIPVAWATGDQVIKFLGYGPADRPPVPQIALLDREGKIRYQTNAQATDELRTDATLRARITELLGSPATQLGSAPPAPRPTKVRR